MIRRAIAVVILAACLVLLTGCRDEAKDCAASGGTWTSHTVMLPSLIGKTVILMPHTIWECAS